MLPKALFLSTIEKIRQQEVRIDEFDKALSKMCDGFPAFDKDNLYLLALRDLLKYTMQDQYDNIGWWLYEAPDAGYTVSWEEAGKEVSVDLTEAGALYVNCTPFVRQYGILSNKWGVLLCQKEYQTNDIRRNSKNGH